MDQNKNRYIELQNDVRELVGEAVDSFILDEDELDDIVERIIQRVSKSDNHTNWGNGVDSSIEY